MNAERYADEYFNECSSDLNFDRVVLINLIKRVQRDQRHACAEAILALPVGEWDISVAHQAVMNAEPKGDSL